MSYPNDNYADATVLTGDAGSITPFHYDGISDPATSETGEDTYGIGETLWWKWTATADGVAFFTTRFSPSDDGDSSGLDTKIRVLSDFTTVLAHNDDDPDPPPGSYDYNSYVEFDAVAGTTYWCQVDMYGSGQAGTLHFSWGTAAAPGPWTSSPPVALPATTLVDTLTEFGRGYFSAVGRKTEGDTWAGIAEVTAGLAGRGSYSSPPLRPTYAAFGYAGEPAEGGSWASVGIDPPPDEFSNELNPFWIDWDSRVADLTLPTPDLPTGAVGWEFEGFPSSTHGLFYVPSVDKSWVTAGAVRALLEVNRTVSFGTPVASADAGWRWITPPVAGVAGPQTVSFRHDGPGIVSPGFISIGFSWGGGQISLGTGTGPSSMADDSFAIYDYTFDLGALEYVDSFYGEIDVDNGVHWTASPSGWEDYAYIDTSAFLDARAFSPEPLTVQIRSLDLDGTDGHRSTYQTGAALGAAALLFEQTTAGALDESIDTGWVDLDITSLADYLYLNYAEQVTHTSPEPASLPARDARHRHGDPTSSPVSGTEVMYGSTVSFERPTDGSTRQIQLRFTYQAPRIRFYYSGAPPTPVSGWQVGSVAW